VVAPQPSAPPRSWFRKAAAALLVLGPGVLSMAGDNDAGGLLSYAATGMRFGPSLFVPLMLPLVALSFVVQEMAMRLGAVTGKGFATLLRERVDRRWAVLAAADLALTNWFSLVTEFAGMGIGLAHFGVPLALGVPLSLAVVLGLAVWLPYRRLERLALGVAATSVLFLPVALRLHPPLGSIGLWPRDAGPDLGFFVLATVGNAMAPWMVFFQSTAVRGRGASGLRAGRLDLAAGSVLQGTVAVAVLLVAAAAPMGQGFSAAGWLVHLGSPWLAGLFAVGLFDAGFVAALTVGLASAWAVAETCTAEPAREGRRVRAIYAAGLVTAAAAVLVPHLPLDLVAVGAQAASGILMPPVVGLLLLLCNDARLGRHGRNTRLGNLAGALAAAVFTLASLALLWSGGSA
jgi:Mn2+/Fe2+ NRAMP family transporter